MQSIRVGRKAVEKAVAVLRTGKVVAYPTETCYGLGADATDSVAVKKVFEAKKRPAGKPFVVIVADEKVAGKYFKLSPLAKALVREFMPGPLTLIVPARRGALAKLVLKKGGAAFRIPSHSFALSLARSFGKPVVSTSANSSGEPPAYSAEKVAREFGGKISLLVDAGGLPRRRPSTMVDLTAEKPVLVRIGPRASAVRRFLKRISS
ncbi:threonylcarbamoyl-AMP synthase [Candidatus Micrarchaeota archaeon]|nr:threonylcarbamoyl-AMP synthase [Candidatus Micrarchaeota archaeon]